MVRKNIIKPVVVSKPADKLIEKMSKILDLHDVCINGDKGVSVSSFMGAAFEVVINSSDKETKLHSLLINHFGLKDKNGDPIEPEKLKSYIAEAFDVINN